MSKQGRGRTGSSSQPPLPAPDVVLGEDFMRRLEQLAVRLASARERHEGAGAAALAGGGEEFTGYRPYRPGEDLRGLDWNLFARLDRPYVRVTRRESSERWELLIDTSASMGVGPPGKLQATAELSLALACVGLRGGARVRLVLSPGSGEQAESRELRRLGDLRAGMEFLERCSAAGSGGLSELLTRHTPARDAGRVFVLGDLCDLSPSRAFDLSRRRRELFAVQMLAPVELSPPREGSVEWVDPEGAGRRSVSLGGREASSYERNLEHQLERWANFASRHGIRYVCASSARAFEDIAQELLTR